MRTRHNLWQARIGLNGESLAPRRRSRHQVEVPIFSWSRVRPKRKLPPPPPEPQVGLLTKQPFMPE